MAAQPNVTVLEDWKNREFVETVEIGVRKCVDFLNNFHESAKYRLSVVDARLCTLERKLDFLEASLEHCDPSKRGAKPIAFVGSIFDPEIRKKLVAKNEQNAADNRQRKFSTHVVAPNKTKVPGRPIVNTQQASSASAASTKPKPKPKPKSKPAPAPAQAQAQPHQAPPQVPQPKAKTTAPDSVAVAAASASKPPPAVPPAVPAAVPAAAAVPKKAVQKPPPNPVVQHSKPPPAVPPAVPAAAAVPPKVPKKAVQKPPPNPVVQQPPPQPPVPQPAQSAAKPPPPNPAKDSAVRPAVAAVVQQAPPQPPQPPGPGSRSKSNSNSKGTAAAVVQPPPPQPPQPQPIVEPQSHAPPPSSAEPGAAAAPASAAAPSNQQIDITYVKEGDGPIPGASSAVEIEYSGFLQNGKQFITHREVIQLGKKQNIKGLEQAVIRIKVGSIIKLWIPSRLAYGARGAGNLIPPDSDLTFNLKLHRIVQQ
eukprot:CAMPEP_0202727452 /NCGR_PEP_ID=MMETSP1385-20130828/185128_1 /ASSEMBLY_ACC=CAM_ASM_000861 /TAXON_ID=933848 /ORGANISM="Elphidium margaritaceum" /LENGTH=477 /DNA_ID=CAMNT_0049393691 /DNA_START=33 /DNA_END=1466 /DNA_ORIENTATION=+